MKLEEKITGKRKVYKGNIIDVEIFDVELPNGKKATRDVVVHPGATVVIPVNEKGELYLVKQFRTPVGETMLELPAGKLDPGENPEECAKRELREETGLKSENIKHLISINTTPGFSNEVLHMYAATGLKEGESSTDEDEFLTTEKIHVEKLLEMVLNHEITDAKTIIGILLAEKIIKGEIII